MNVIFKKLRHIHKAPLILVVQALEGLITKLINFHFKNNTIEFLLYGCFHDIYSRP